MRCFAVILVIACASHVQGQVIYVVNTLQDTVDANPGDGVALDAFGETSLRAAVMEMNAQIANGNFGPYEILLDWMLISPSLDPCNNGAQAVYELNIIAPPPGTPGYDPNSAAWDDLDINGPPVGVPPVDVTIRAVNACAPLGGGVIAQDPLVPHPTNPYPIPCLDPFLGIPPVVSRPAAHIAWNLMQQTDRDRIFDARNVSITLIDVELSGGRATGSDGGAIRAEDSAVTLENVIIQDHIAGNNGGGVALQSIGTPASLDISNTRFCQCEAGLGNGGGIATQGVQTTTQVNDSYILSCRSNQRLGGGAFLSGDLAFNFINDTLVGECEAALGGGLYLRNSTVIERSRIRGNSAGGVVPFPDGPFDPVSAGGGIYVDGSLQIYDSHVQSNFASRGADSPPHDRGGGIFVNSFRTLHAERCSIFENDTGALNALFDNGHGGGIHSQGTITLTNCTIGDNNAGSLGAGVYILSGSASLNHLTIARNRIRKLPTDGSGLFIAGGNVGVRSTLIAENEVMDPNNFPALSFDPGGNCGVHPLFGPGPGTDYNLDTDGSCIGAGWFGPNSIASAPGINLALSPLTCGVTDMYPLLVGADAIDNADPNCEDLAGNTLLDDQCGNARPSGPLCDIGAIEQGATGVPPACQTAMQNCYITSATPGCSDPVCCAAVGACDPFCISNTWDPACVGPNPFTPGCSAVELPQCVGCGDPGNNCCQPSATGTAYCDNAACCVLICANDPFCCDVEWDGICATDAQAQCPICQQCVTCPVGAVQVCGACSSGICHGCSVGLHPMPAQCGAWHCGELEADAGVFDEHWYELTVPPLSGGSGDATITIEADMDVEVEFFIGGCSLQSLGVMTSNACVTTTMTVLVVPGFFDIVVRPVAGTSGHPCGTANTYSLHIDVVDQAGHSCGCPTSLNDECSSVVPGHGATPAVLGSNFTDFCASTASDPAELPPDCPFLGFGGAGSNDDDIWFEFTSTCAAGTARQFDFHLVPFGPDDRKLAIYDGCPPATLMACEESFFGGVSSIPNFDLTPGQTVYLRAGSPDGGIGGHAGDLFIGYSIPCPADIASPTGGLGTTDCVVNGFDLLALLGCWGPVLPGSLCALADFTGPVGIPDNIVNGFDLLFLLSEWTGPSGCP